MTDDNNSFVLGPAKIDVDRDLYDTITQGIGQTTGVSGTAQTTVLGGPAELLVGVASAVSQGGTRITVRADDGSVLGVATNATAKKIDVGSSVIVGRTRDGFVVVGFIGRFGDLDLISSTLFNAFSSTDIGLARVAVDTTNSLSLGADTIVSRGPISSPPTALAGTTYYTTSAGVSGPLTTLGQGYWYGFHAGDLYMVSQVSTNSTLYRLDKTTGTWNVIAANCHGAPIIRSSGLYATSGSDVIQVVNGTTTNTFSSTTYSGRSITPGGFGSRYLWIIGTTSIGLFDTSNNTSRLVFADRLFAGTIGSVVTNSPVPLWSSGPNNLMGLANTGSGGYSAYIYRPNGRAFIVPDFMLNIGRVSDLYGNNPAYVTIQSVTAINDNSMYLAGAYSPDAGTSWIPTIWRFTYFTSTGQYTVAQKWQIDLGTSYTGFAYGLSRDNLPAGQVAWSVGEMNTTGQKALFIAELD